MASMFVPKMVPELDTLKAFQSIGKNVREGIENQQRMEILSKVDASDPNSLTEAIGRLRATGRLDDIYMADRLDQSFLKREESKYNRGAAEEDRGIERERVRRLNAPGVPMPGIGGIPGAPVSPGAGAAPARPASPHSYLDVDVPDEPPPTPTRPAVAPVQAEGAASMGGGRPPAPTSVLGLSAAPAQTPQAAPAPPRRVPGPAPVPVAGPSAPSAAPSAAAQPGGEQYAQAGPLPPPPPRPPVSSTGGRPAPAAPAAAAPAPQAPPSPEAQWQAFVQDRISRLEYAKTPGEVAKLRAQITYGQTQIDALRAPQEASDKEAHEQRKALYGVQARSLGKMVETAGLRRQELDQARNIGESLKQIVNMPNFPEHSPGAALRAQQISRNFTQYAKSFGLDAVLPVDAVNAVIYNRTGGEGPQIANAYMQQLAGAILKATVGSTAISNADREFVKEMQANPNMSRAAILRMIDIMDRHSGRESQKQKIILESADEPGMTPARLQRRLQNFEKLNSVNPRGQKEAPERPSPEGSSGTVGGGKPAPAAPSGTTKSGVNWSIK